MKYSIIVSFYNGKNILDYSLYHTIRTIQYQTDVEIIVVNDNPQISITNIIDKHSKDINIKLINVEKNGGHPKACNIGADLAKGEYLIFMDCDIFPTPGWLDEMQKSFLSNNDVGSVGATIVDMSTNRVTITGLELNGVDVIKPYFERNFSHLRRIKDEEYTFIPSGCIMMKHSLFNDIGGFNTTYFNAYGDMDLSGKIYMKGLKNYVCSKAVVYHRGNIGGEMRSLSVNDTKALFFKEWGNRPVYHAMDFLNKSFNVFKNENNLEKKYILINLSKSLLINEYIDCVENCLNINITNMYNFKAYSDIPLIINDIVSVEQSTANIPILFFISKFTFAKDNHFWIQNRNNKNDIVFDIHGNIMFLKDICHY